MKEPGLPFYALGGGESDGFSVQGILLWGPLFVVEEASLVLLLTGPQITEMRANIDAQSNIHLLVVLEIETG